MPSGFDVTASILSVVYAFFGIKFAISLRHSTFRIPLTSQQQVVLACALFCLTRAVFFIVCIYAWNETAGLVENKRVTFNSLDAMAHVLFLVIISAVILFWAKVFSTAGGPNQIRAFDRCVCPAVVLTSIAALVGVVTTLFEQSSRWNFGFHLLPISGSTTTRQNIDESYMFVMSTSFLLSIAYFLAAAALAHYMQQAAKVLEEAPVVLSARLQRLTSLRRLGVFLVLILLCRCVVLLCLSDRVLHTVTIGQLVTFAAVYIVLEVLPLQVIGSIYRIEAPPTDSRQFGLNSSPRSALRLFALDSEEDASFEGGVHSGEVQPLLRARADGEQAKASQALGLVDKGGESARILQRMSLFSD
jgi:hypothetical protein